MRICILCEDSKVELARENSKKIFKTTDSPVPANIAKIKENLGISLDAGHLKIPVSATGELPATHWFCFMNTTEQGYKNALGNNLYSIIEESSPKEFLAKWNLQLIKSTPTS